MKFKQTGNEEKTRYWIDGREVGGEEWYESLETERSALPQPAPDDTQPGNRPWSKPILSDALAVHPDQIPEVMERNRKHGLEVEYEQEFGRPILKDRDQRRRLCRIEGVHDNQGGYGDA